MRPSYNPSKVSRRRKCGFLARQTTRGGRAVLASRRRKGRRKLSD